MILACECGMMTSVGSKGRYEEKHLKCIYNLEIFFELFFFVIFRIGANINIYYEIYTIWIQISDFSVVWNNDQKHKKTFMKFIIWHLIRKKYIGHCLRKYQLEPRHFRLFISCYWNI